MNDLIFAKSVHLALWGAESWEISAHPSDPSRVDLNALFPSFPLLFKVIDAKTRLSVQVHPNEETCKVTSGEPKTEMWCALSDEFLALYTARNEIDLDGKRVLEGTSVLLPPSSTCDLFATDSLLLQTRFKGRA